MTTRLLSFKFPLEKGFRATLSHILKLKISFNLRSTHEKQFSSLEKKKTTFDPRKFPPNEYASFSTDHHLSIPALPIKPADPKSAARTRHHGYRFIFSPAKFWRARKLNSIDSRGNPARKQDFGAPSCSQVAAII